jgi:hypothetical protein
VIDKPDSLFRFQILTHGKSNSAVSGSEIPPGKKELVGGAITILKNMKVNGKNYPIYYGK